MDETLSPTSLGVSIAAMTLSLAALGVAAARALSGRPLIRFEPREPAPWTAWEVSWVLFYVGLSILAGAFAGAEEEPAISPGEFLSSLAFMAALHTGIIALALGCARLRTPLTLRDLGLRRDTALRDVRLGVAAFLVALLPVYLVQAVVWYGFGQQQPHVLLEMVAADPRLFWPCAVSAVVVAPLTEELMFRLLLQGWLERVQMLRHRRSFGPADSSRDSSAVASLPAAEPALDAPQAGFAPALEKSEGSPFIASWNPYESPVHANALSGEYAAISPDDVRPGRLSLLLPAMLFALVHGWPNCLPLFVFALALGYVYRQTHRILPCIVLHICLNGASMLLVGLELWA